MSEATAVLSTAAAGAYGPGETVSHQRQFSLKFSIYWRKRLCRSTFSAVIDANGPLDEDVSGHPLFSLRVVMRVVDRNCVIISLNCIVTSDTISTLVKSKHCT